MQDFAREIVLGKGYAILPELFTPQEISAARAHILELATAQPAGRFMQAGASSTNCWVQQKYSSKWYSIHM